MQVLISPFESVLVQISKTIRTHQKFLTCFGVLFVLLLLLMPPGDWHDNEETKLGSAWRQVSPPAIAAISALTDDSLHRFLFTFLNNLGIVSVGLDWTHYLGRLLVITLYALTLTSFFRALKFSIVEASFILLLFVHTGEDILGGEWLFRGYEPKTLAYPFVFLSFANFLKDRFRATYFCLAIATYFHFLVGGFWLLVVLACDLYRNRATKRIFKQFLQYLLICSPLIGLIAFDQIRNSVSQTNPSPDWIYTFYRNAHHVAPFALPQLTDAWYVGIIFLTVLTIIFGCFSFYFKQPNEQQAARLIFGLNLYLFAALAISFFDKTGFWGRFYLFRPSSITYFLALCFFVALLKSRVAKSHLIFVALLACVGLASLPLIPKKLKALRPLAPDYPPAVRQLVAQTNPTDIFLVDFALEEKWIAFERSLDRPTLIMHKFVPTGSAPLIRWYELVQRRDQVFQTGCPASIVAEYHVAYLLTPAKSNIPLSCGAAIYRDQRIQLIRVDEKFRK